jgi:hypothetical protein
MKTGKKLGQVLREKGFPEDVSGCANKLPGYNHGITAFWFSIKTDKQNAKKLTPQQAESRSRAGEAVPLNLQTLAK